MSADRAEPGGQEPCPREDHGRLTHGAQQRLRPGKLSRREVREHQRRRLQAALLALIAEGGYETVTARSLCARAGVSTRTLYELYGGKERLFLALHAALAERAARRAEAAWARNPRWPEGLRLILEDWLADIAANPLPARAILLEPYAVGGQALAALAAVQGRFVALLARSLREDPLGRTLPPVLAEALQAGIARVITAAIARGATGSLPALRDPLCSWAASYLHPEAALLAALQREDLGPGAAPQRWQPPASERERLLAATISLAGSGGYRSLSVAAICNAAGLPQGAFNRNFADVEECFLAAYEQVALRALLVASAAARQAAGWQGALHRASLALARHFAREQAEARLAFIEVLAAGRAGLEARERVLEPLGGLLGRLIPQKRRPSEVVLEATLGAVWGLAQGRLAAGRAGELTALVPFFSYLALAPVLGAKDALAAIRAEHGALRAQQLLPEPQGGQTRADGRGSRA